MRVLALFLLTTIAQAGTYTNATSGLSFKYPDTWEEVVEPAKPGQAEVDQAMTNRTLVTLQKKVADRDGDTVYRSRFSVVVDELNQIPKVKDAKGDKATAYKKHATSFLEGQRFALDKETESKLPGVKNPVWEVIGHQRDLGLSLKQYLLVQNDKAYLFTATTRTKVYPQAEPELNEIFQSIKLP